MSNLSLPESKLLIGGRWVDAIENATFPVINPATEELISMVAEARADDVDAAVRAAHRALHEGPWGRMSGAERGRILYKLAELLEARQEDLVILESLNAGKPLVRVEVAPGRFVKCHEGDEARVREHFARQLEGRR